ncbi:MAG: hypothetical protein CSB55_03605 [Candidatus Cloacimonadota bacterium]|nr:MAG: hypothetical protein CSB55_03605 [Candidatus Cloacimonadota bacterium]
MKKYFFTVFVVMVCLSLSAKKLKFKSNVKNGILFATNKNLVLNKEELQVSVKISSENEDEFPFGSITGIAVAPDNSLFIADGSNAEIFHYSEDGKFIKKTGKKGNGPYEFSVLSSIACFDDKLIVCDSGNHRIYTFDLDGNPVSSTVTSMTNLKSILRVGDKFVTDSWIISETDSLFLLHSLNDKFEPVGHFGFLSNGGFDFKSLIRNMSDICVNSKGEIYVNTLESGIISKYKNGKKTAEIKRPLLQKSSKTGIESQKDGARMVYTAEIKSVSSMAAVDSKDNFYSVLRPSKSEEDEAESVLQIINPDGKVIGNYSLGNKKADALAIDGNDCIWIVDTEENEMIYKFEPVAEK